jgi:hypothetical protein
MDTFSLTKIRYFITLLKKVSDFLVPSRYVTNQTLLWPGLFEFLGIPDRIAYQPVVSQRLIRAKPNQLHRMVQLDVRLRTAIQLVEVTVNSTEENSEEFCLDFVQEFGLWLPVFFYLHTHRLIRNEVAF